MGNKKGSKAPEIVRISKMSIPVPTARGGGIISIEAWGHNEEPITKYNLAYINFDICRRDNGRVLGYDTNHGSLHRYYMGEVQELEFTTYKEMLQRFQAEVNEYLKHTR